MNLRNTKKVTTHSTDINSLSLLGKYIGKLNIYKNIGIMNSHKESFP